MVDSAESTMMHGLTNPKFKKHTLHPDRQLAAAAAAFVRPVGVVYVAGCQGAAVMCQ